MFTSRRLTGIEAAAIGLVDRAVADEDLDAAIAGLAAEILKNSQGTNRRVKKLIQTQSDMTRTDALLHEPPAADPPPARHEAHQEDSP